MTDGGIKLGSHDKGFWDPSNTVKAAKKPLAEDLEIEQALETAKQHDGAELVVINARGKASVHSLFVEDALWKENKQVLISELDRDPAPKQNQAQTPLAIDDHVSQAFGGEGAFLVDARNQTTYLGADVDQTTAAVKLKDAEAYLHNPTPDRVNAAYAIAKDAGQERHVDQKLSAQVLDDLQRDYRQSAPAEQKIDLLKSGEAKTQVKNLLTELKTIAGQESTRVAELNQQLQARTATWQTELQSATPQRDAAQEAWNTQNQRETQAVSTAAQALREARFPGAQKLEKTRSEAQKQRSQTKSQLESATAQRLEAQKRVNKLERLPGEAEGRLQQARQLESENRGMYFQIQNYTTLTLSRVSAERRSTEQEYSRANTDLELERNKPPRPSSSTPNSGGSSPNGVDPFKPGSGGGSPNGVDPFNPGSGSSDGNSSSSPNGVDPFADANKYRDYNKINRLETRVSQLRRELRDLKERESSLESVNQRLAYTRDIDQLSLFFYDLDPLDRMALSQYKDRKDNNERAIAGHQRAARELQARYENETPGANRQLSAATSEEEGARGRYSQAENRLASLEQEQRDLLNNPRPDSHAEVQPFYSAHQQAQAHKEATVGAQAPLTLKRAQTQQAVDQLNRVYRSDQDSLNSQIIRVKQTLADEARHKIETTRHQVVK
jgi:hypothetical protein